MAGRYTAGIYIRVDNSSGQAPQEQPLLSLIPSPATAHVLTNICADLSANTGHRLPTLTKSWRIDWWLGYGPEVRSTEGIRESVVDEPNLVR